MAFFVQTTRFPTIIVIDVLWLFRRTSLSKKPPDIKLCCLHFYVMGNSLIDGAEKTECIFLINCNICRMCRTQIHSPMDTELPIVFLPWWQLFFFTVLNERDFKASLILVKKENILLSQIMVRSRLKPTEKHHLGEVLNWSLEISEAERCFRYPLNQGISGRCT